MRLVINRSMKSAATFAALFFVAGLVAADEIVTRQFDGFEIVHLASLPDEGVDEVAAQVNRAIQQVTTWLEQSDSYQGPPYKKQMRVLIDPEETTPAQMRSTIFVPEVRVREALRSGSLANVDLGIVHEITHVLAASAYRKDRNRFYDDGLAVYLQHIYGPPNNYPVLGTNIHKAVADVAQEHGSLIPLSDADQARRDSGVRRRLGYLQLGSFTKFLVDNFGVDSYIRIYQGAPLVEVTGLDLQALEERWATEVTCD